MREIKENRVNGKSERGRAMRAASLRARERDVSGNIRPEGSSQGMYVLRKMVASQGMNLPGEIIEKERRRLSRERGLPREGW